MGKTPSEILSPLSLPYNRLLQIIRSVMNKPNTAKFLFCHFSFFLMASKNPYQEVFLFFLFESRMKASKSIPRSFKAFIQNMYEGVYTHPQNTRIARKKSSEPIPKAFKLRIESGFSRISSVYIWLCLLHTAGVLLYTIQHPTRPTYGGDGDIVPRGT